jgi:hypothetical protein
MSESESYEFEDRFSLVLAAAESVIGRSNMALQENILQNVRRHSMPEIPVWRLHLVATSTFLGVIQCLRTKPSSPGAFSLLRGLIEAWAHLFFIADESEPDTPALRSIRFEAGVLSEWASVRKKMDPVIDYDQLIARNREGIMKLWTASWGRNEPRRRTYKDVNPTLEKMARVPELNSLGIIRAASSVAVHASAADFLLEVDDHGARVIWASDAQRCAWLQLAIMSFDYLTISALLSVPGPDRATVIEDLHTSWQSIFNDPLLVNAVSAEGEVEMHL